MYYITELLNGEWQCYCQVQDGKEVWIEKTRPKAIAALIQAARVLNHSVIREDDIKFFKISNSDLPISIGDLKLLESIRSGAKVVLSHDDPRVKITPQECDFIEKVREVYNGT